MACSSSVSRLLRLRGSSQLKEAVEAHLRALGDAEAIRVVASRRRVERANMVVGEITQQGGRSESKRTAPMQVKMAQYDMKISTGMISVGTEAVRQRLGKRRTHQTPQFEHSYIYNVDLAVATLTSSAAWN